MQKKYAIELDVLISAGEESVIRLAGNENTVYLPYDELERRGHEDSRDPNRYEFERVLNFLNKYIDPDLARTKKEIILPAGGRVTWKNPSYDVDHITRSPSRTSELKRKGKRADFPEFLKYSLDPLKSGLIDLEYNGNPSGLCAEDICELANLDSLSPNQHYRVNNGPVYRSVFNFSSNPEGNRFFVEGEPRIAEIPEDKIKNLYIKTKLPGFSAWNLEQMLCFDRVRSKDVEVAFITGGSGSGKSVLAYAIALEEILGPESERRNGNTKDGIILFKTNDIIAEDKKSRELGILPGSLFQKTFKMMGNFVDAHNLCGINPGEMPFKEMLYHPREEDSADGFPKRSKHKIGEWYLPAKNKAIEIEHLQNCRGRTFNNKVIFIDEAQNYTPFEMKQLAERVGENCKVLIVGDPEGQVDNPRLSPEFNGLVWAAKVLKEDLFPKVSFMYLDRNYRSHLAETIRNHRAPRVR